MKALGLALGLILVFGVLSSANAEYTEKNAKKEKSSAYDLSDIVSKAISKKDVDKKTDAKKIDAKKLTKSKGKPQRKTKQN